MMKLDSVLVFSEHPEKLAAFYEKVFAVKPGWSEGQYVGFDIGGSYFMVGPHDKVQGMSKEPMRVMVNFGVSDVKAEFDRVKALGAEVVAVPYQPGEAKDMWLCTFADPDGNYFQFGSEMKK
jgi:predicted enzyme related to lactoylglutathione lyase